MRRPLSAFATFAAAGVCLWAQTLAAAIPAFGAPQLNYLQRCGGCHGLQGRSVPQVVPTLRGQVGYYMCIPEGRAYIVQVPNVALASLPDTDLADLMNYVVFELGGNSTASTVARYSSAEVGALRKRVLNAGSLKAARASVVAKAMRQCHAPQSLEDYAPAVARGR
jgi:cytochrome c553